MLSNKSITIEKIVSVEIGKILSNDNEIAEGLNNFFSNIIKTLWILQNGYFDLFIGDIDDPRLRAIVQYPQYPSMLAIKEKCKKWKPFLVFTCNAWGSFYKNTKPWCFQRIPRNRYSHKNSEKKMQIYLQILYFKVSVIRFLHPFFQ